MIIMNGFSVLDIEFYYAAKGKMIRPPRPGIFAESCTFMISSNTSQQYRMVDDMSIDASVLRILATGVAKLSIRGIITKENYRQFTID